MFSHADISPNKVIFVQCFSVARCCTDVFFVQKFTVGANNIFDNDPAVCLNTCGSTNMSAVVHDLPGTVAYFKVSYLH